MSIAKRLIDPVQLLLDPETGDGRSALEMLVRRAAERGWMNCMRAYAAGVGSPDDLMEAVVGEVIQALAPYEERMEIVQ